MASFVFYKPTSALPNKASALILLALKDLWSVSKDPRYRIDMASWHSYRSCSRFCAVCLAGSVMARHFSVPPGINADLRGFRDFDGAKLRALDILRQFANEEDGGPVITRVLGAVSEVEGDYPTDILPSEVIRLWETLNTRFGHAFISDTQTDEVPPTKAQREQLIHFTHWMVVLAVWLKKRGH